MKVKDLVAPSYFVMRGRDCPFYFDEEGRYTRLWDGADADGFLKNPNQEIEIISDPEAMERGLYELRTN